MFLINVADKNRLILNIRLLSLLCFGERNEMSEKLLSVIKHRVF